MAKLTYTPPDSVKDFLQSDNFINMIVGPVGCVSNDTEYLTPAGWKRIDEYASGDLVAQWHPDGFAEFVEPIRYIKEPCKELLYFSHQYGLSQKLSPEHRVVYRLRRKGEKLHVKTAAEIADWHWKNGADMVRIPTVFDAPERQGLGWSDFEVRLRVAIAADGYLPDRPNAVCMNLKKQYKKDRLEYLLNSLGISFAIHKSGEGYSRYYFHLPGAQKTLGTWWCANKEQLKIVADEVTHWDGAEKDSGLVFHSTDKPTADFVQYAFISQGLTTSLTAEHTDRENCVYRVYARKNSSGHIGIAGNSQGVLSNNIQVVSTEDGYKYCFEVPTGYLVLRHNNCVFVTGNSTKTTAGIVKIAMEASKMAKSRDGIRRSRYVWVRQTREQLRDSSIPDFLKWFPDGQAGVFMKTDYRYILKFDDVEAEILFRGLDEANDVRRLLSLNISGGIVEEFRELNPEIFRALQGRIGRYPDGLVVPHRPEWGVDKKGNPIQGCVTDDGKPNARLWGMSNPPDMDTFWEDFLTNPPDNASVFFQPSGLSPEADWIQYLPSGYYDNLANGKTQDWIDVYINAKFGKSLAGKPVFRAFDKSTHVAKDPLSPMRNSTVLVGFDCTGLNPAAVIGQLSWTGQLRIYDCISVTDMGVLRFIREKLKPILVNKYSGMSVLAVIDPAGMSRDTEERTVKDLLENEGIATVPASTNNIAARIAAVEAFLTKTVNGEAGLSIDPGLFELIQTLQSKYRFKVKSNGDAEDKPDKAHPWADIADAVQYLCLHADGGNLFGSELRGEKRREIVKAPVRFSR